MCTHVYMCAYVCVWVPLPACVHVYAHAHAFSWKFFYFSFTKIPIFCDIYHQFETTFISSNWQLHDKVMLFGTNTLHMFAVVCPAGQFRNDSTNTCEDCPISKYQENTGQTSCSSCPTSYTTAAPASNSSSDCYSELISSMGLVCQELGCSSVLEHQTHDQEFLGLIPDRSSRQISPSDRVSFLRWLLFQFLFHVCITAVAHKRPRSFCKEFRWQVPAKHAYMHDPVKSEWAVDWLYFPIILWESIRETTSQTACKGMFFHKNWPA